MNKAFFLDRDGTINKDTGYVMQADDVELLDGVGEAIHKINQAGYYAIVVSNQSGVARGIGSEEDVQQVNQRISELLQQYDARIDAFYYCPHLKDGTVARYAIDCDCRKPKLGLYQRAIKEFELKPELCAAVGDKLRDVELLPTIGVKQCGVIKEDGKYNSLLAFVNEILG